MPITKDYNQMTTHEFAAHTNYVRRMEEERRQPREECFAEDSFEACMMYYACLPVWFILSTLGKLCLKGTIWCMERYCDSDEEDNDSNRERLLEEGNSSSEDSEDEEPTFHNQQPQDYYPTYQNSYQQQGSYYPPGQHAQYPQQHMPYSGAMAMGGNYDDAMIS